MKPVTIKNLKEKIKRMKAEGKNTEHLEKILTQLKLAKSKKGKVTHIDIKKKFLKDFVSCICGNTNIREIKKRGNFLICKKCNRKHNTLIIFK